MRLTLSDGTRVRVRRIVPEDKALLAAALTRLSPDTRYRRFLGPKPRFSERELRYLTEVDGHEHIALVAVDADRPDFLIAVARIVRVADRPDTAEMAIVVGDPWQGLGLGRRMAELLTCRAAREGVRQVSGTMLADNRPALRLMRGISGGFDQDAISGGVREIVTRLKGAEPAPIQLV
jgi:RimJ/RimL family protein N-acetyltransferase